MPRRTPNGWWPTLIDPGDVVVLVTPIDSAAPKGRLILPQQQVIRDILDAGGINVVVKESELTAALAALGKRPKLVITDSQAFQGRQPGHAGGHFAHLLLHPVRPLQG